MRIVVDEGEDEAAEAEAENERSRGQTSVWIEGTIRRRVDAKPFLGDQFDGRSAGTTNALMFVADRGAKVARLTRRIGDGAFVLNVKRQQIVRSQLINGRIPAERTIRQEQIVFAGVEKWNIFQRKNRSGIQISSRRFVIAFGQKTRDG